MSDQVRSAARAQLEPFVGDWTMEIDFPGMDRIDAGTSVSFEWSPGGWFLLERWHIPVPEFPDGTAVIGWDNGRHMLLQHYFDSRGVARVYEMVVEDGRWTLTRTEPDFSPLDFAQRYIGEFSDDGRTITGRWEAKHPGKDWEVDFHITYRRPAPRGA
jgi:hypothetical protein